MKERHEWMKRRARTGGERMKEALVRGANASVEAHTAGGGTCMAGGGAYMPRGGPHG
jgi:hypothetical protein